MYVVDMHKKRKLEQMKRIHVFIDIVGRNVTAKCFKSDEHENKTRHRKTKLKHDNQIGKWHSNVFND